MRRRLYEILSVADGDDVPSRIYDIVMIIAVVASMVPLWFKEDALAFDVIDIVCTLLFIFDYIARLATADIHLGKGARSFVQYPFTPMAILDLLSILPGLIEINPAFRVLRLARLLKMLRIFKFVRYSRSLKVLEAVMRKNGQLLICVVVIALVYILISATVVFNVEPDTFDTFFDAFYWACMSLSTVGYGDIYCVTFIGKVFTILSALVGIAIIALPAGIITGGFVDELKNFKDGE